MPQKSWEASFALPSQISFFFFVRDIKYQMTVGFVDISEQKGQEIKAKEEMSQ